MKKSVIIAAIAASLVGGAAFASSVPTASYSIAPHMTPIAINKVNDDSNVNQSWYFELLLGASDALTTFKLVDTSEDGSKVTYTLFEDNESATNSIDIGALLISKTITDDIAPTFFDYLLQGGEQYVLKIENINPIDFSKTQISAVPLPGAALLFGSVLAGAGFMGRKKMFKGSETAA